MNSDPFTLEGIPDGHPSPTEETSSSRRRRTRRSANATAPAAEAASAAPAEATTETTTAHTTTPRGRRRAASAAQPTPTTAETPARATRPRRAGAPAMPPTVEEPAPAQSAETPAEIVMPLTAQDALVSMGSADDTVAAEAPLARSRRRRGRGGRGAAPENAPETTAAVDIAPASDESQAWARLAEAPDFASAADAEIGEAAPEEITETEAGAAATGRRRRRRGRGGRATAQDTTTAPEEESESVTAREVATPIPSASPGAAGGIELTPAVLRRFDHRDWRERPGRAMARPAPAASQVAAHATEPRQAETAAPRHVDTAAAQPAPVPAARSAPVPFERPERGRRFPERQPASTSEATQPGAPLPAALVPPSVTTAPAVRSSAAPSRVTSAPAIDIAPGGGIEERLERMLAGQAALLQQQQQALQSVTAAMASLQSAIERMSTHGIAAGMPRAGMFVDAPNVVYAAENARVNIDYGRMLDFLGRGREMVHAIVYAPVTEETGYRMENQRFVAPFLNKGYKLVTKPLKRFPDGTAKGNFDIELAIDIVTMSQRLDVVVLISGDSDFSRLIELIQSRGVRVEVVAFASNVSWELVQMADVFIDIGQYLDEFRAV